MPKLSTVTRVYDREHGERVWQLSNGARIIRVPSEFTRDGKRIYIADKGYMTADYKHVPLPTFKLARNVADKF